MPTENDDLNSEVPQAPDTYVSNSDGEDDIFAFCTECLTSIPDSYAERDVFIMSGHSGVCPYCQGPTVVTGPAGAAQIKRRRESGMIVNPKN